MVERLTAIEDRHSHKLIRFAHLSTTKSWQPRSSESEDTDDDSENYFSEQIKRYSTKAVTVCALHLSTSSSTHIQIRLCIHLLQLQKLTSLPKDPSIPQNPEVDFDRLRLAWKTTGYTTHEVCQTTIAASATHNPTQHLRHVFMCGAGLGSLDEFLFVGVVAAIALCGPAYDTVLRGGVRANQKQALQNCLLLVLGSVVGVWEYRRCH